MAVKTHRGALILEIERCDRDSIRAVYAFCEDVQPANVRSLVREVVGNMPVDAEMFDLLADGFALWKEGTELSASSGVE